MKKNDKNKRNKKNIIICIIILALLIGVIAILLINNNSKSNSNGNDHFDIDYTELLKNELKQEDSNIYKNRYNIESFSLTKIDSDEDDALYVIMNLPIEDENYKFIISDVHEENNEVRIYSNGLGTNFERMNDLGFDSDSKHYLSLFYDIEKATYNWYVVYEDSTKNLINLESAKCYSYALSNDIPSECNESSLLFKDEDYITSDGSLSTFDKRFIKIPSDEYINKESFDNNFKFYDLEVNYIDELVKKYLKNSITINDINKNKELYKYVESEINKINEKEQQEAKTAEEEQSETSKVEDTTMSTQQSSNTFTANGYTLHYGNYSDGILTFDVTKGKFTISGDVIDFGQWGLRIVGNDKLGSLETNDTTTYNYVGH